MRLIETIVEAAERRPVRSSLALIAAFWGALAIVGTIALAQPRFPFGGNWEELVHRGPGLGLLAFWQRWDALWYQHIVAAGYGPDDGSAAFFPLYPGLARLASLFFGGAALPGLLVVSAVALAVAIPLLLRLVREVVTTEPASGSRAGLVTVGLVLLFPTGFFLLAPFTEGLFLALTLATILLARSGRPWLAGLTGALAAATRFQGVFLALSIAAEVLARRRGAGQIGRPARPSTALLAAVLPICGLAGVAGFQATLGGSGPGLATQALWGYTVVAPWEAIGASLAHIGDGARTLGARLVEAGNLGALLGATAICVLGLRRLPASLSLYALPSLGLLFVRDMFFSPLMSSMRYVLVVFPVFILAGAWLADRPRLAAGVLVAGAVVEIATFSYFVRWGFVG